MYCPDDRILDANGNAQRALPFGAASNDRHHDANANAPRAVGLQTGWQCSATSMTAMPMEMLSKLYGYKLAPGGRLLHAL